MYLNSKHLFFIWWSYHSKKKQTKKGKTLVTLTWTSFPWAPGLIRMGIPSFFQITSNGRSPSATVQITLRRLPWVKLAGNVNFSTNGATIKWFVPKNVFVIFEAVVVHWNKDMENNLFDVCSLTNFWNVRKTFSWWEIKSWHDDGDDHEWCRGASAWKRKECVFWKL